MTESISQELPNDVGSAYLARQFLRENATLDSMRQTEADLLVTELVANAIQHSPDAGTITLTLEQDRATGLKVTVSHPADQDIEGAEPGIGLMVTERFSQRWGTRYDDGMLHVWFVLRTPGSVSLSPDLSDKDLFSKMAEDPASFSEELLGRHSDLARAIAKRYRGKGIDDDDLLQVAQMALLKAIQRFDDSYGDLRPFAAVTISGELKKLLRDRGWSVRVPRALQERSLAVGRATEKLTQDLKRDPSDEEIARELDIDAADVREARTAGRAYSSSSIEKPSENTGLSLLDRLEETDPILFNAEERIMISEAILALPVRQQQILRLRFEEDLTQTEIGDLLDISQMHVSRLLSRAIEDMRARLGESD
jgi:RNA polymerase sigma-B factor